MVTVTKNKKTRRSRQRDTILQIVRDSPRHLSADQIYRIARSEIPNLSLGTVYRNLHLLTETGRISAIRLDDNTTHYDQNCRAHYHFICTRCHRVEDIGLKEDLLARLQLESENQITDIRLELYGVCQACKETEES